MTQRIGIALLLAASAGAQTPSATILDIQGNNWVSYYGDVFDYAKLASSAGIATPLRPTKPFQSFVDIVDIVAVNGRPAKGTWVNTGTPQLRLDPSAAPGLSPPLAISDVLRLAVAVHYLEILQPDGTPIGTIMISGMNFGSPPPGAPVALSRDNLAVVGGTGAFLGARGQAGNAVDSASMNARLTSTSEDPASRRVNGAGANGGFKRLIVHLIPMFRPEVMANANAPAVFHPDFSPVTAAKPAQGGEVVILRMTGLGPTRPGVDPGQVFPADALQEVNSPVEATVNDKPAEVVNRIGWPATVGNYRVDVRIPDGTPAGTAGIQVTAAWIAGSDVKIPIR
jgi:hypothetical protein